MRQFRVMTCNVGNGRAAPEQLVRILGESGADLIGIQELSHRQAREIEKSLERDYPHQALFPGGFAGKAVLSRFPILSSEQLHLSTVRPDLKTIIDLGELQLAFFVAHPPPPRPYWRGLKFDAETWRQIQSLAKLATECSPAILLGDFNLADWWGEYAYLRSAGLKDAFFEAGTERGHTLPRRVGPWKRFLGLNRLLSGLPLPPMVRVDYIWYTEPLACQRAWVGKDTGSDHLPVLAELVWPAASISRLQDVFGESTDDDDSKKTKARPPVNQTAGRPTWRGGMRAIQNPTAGRKRRLDL